jgi:hypothetical protein
VGCGPVVDHRIGGDVAADLPVPVKLVFWLTGKLLQSFRVASTLIPTCMNRHILSC